MPFFVNSGLEILLTICIVKKNFLLAVFCSYPYRFPFSEKQESSFQAIVKP